MSCISSVIVSGLILTTFALHGQTNNNITSSRYCTEIGVFDLVFDDNDIAGAYSLNHKNILGAIWGSLVKDQMEGRWMDSDSSGDVIITFQNNRSWFTADYRNDDEPDKWYKDQYMVLSAPQM